MRHSNLTLAAVLSAIALVTPAQAKEDEQAWQTLNLTYALPDNFRINNELVLRESNAKGFYELENNLMIGKKVNKVVTLWIGYTHDPQYSHGDFTVMEHRVRQQISFDNFAKAGKLKFTGRLRLEERWRDGGVTGTGWRLRPALKVSMPFIGKTTFAVQSEPFINLNKTSYQKVSGFDRIRNSASVTVPLSKKVSIDFGYLNQTTFVRNGENTGDNVFTTGLSASF